MYQAKKYIPHLGKSVFIAEDELSPEVQAKLGGGNEDSGLADKVTTLEGKVSALEGKNSTLENTVQSLKEQLDTLQQTVDNLPTGE